MSLSIRVHIGLDTVTAEMQNGAAPWRASSSIVAGDLRAAVREVLAEVPKPRWLPRRSVVIGVGAHASRVKRLRGLPNIPSAKLLDSVVRENAGRYFLGDVPFVTTTLHRLDDNEAMGGAIDVVVLDAVVEGVRDAGNTIRAIHPEADERLIVRPPQAVDNSTPISQWRAIAAVAAIGVAAVASVLAPALAARRDATRAKGELATLAQAETRAANTARELSRTVATIERIAQFERSRQASTLLLATLNDAIPSESAVTMLRSDSTGVDLVVVSPRAAAVLGALDRVDGIVAPEIIGPISREVVGTKELERATIHFRYHPKNGANERVGYVVDRSDAE